MQGMSSPSSASATEAVVSSNEAAQTYRQIAWRIIPFLFVCYVVAYLDRTNLSFAHFQMQKTLGFSDAVYGLGAGVFFLGYSLLEVPTNLLVQRIGTRATLIRILIPWGAVSVAMAWVSTEPMFYVMRFLLGAFEAGLVPAVLFYLTNWFPENRRGGAISLFMLGMPISGVVGGPIAGWAMGSMNGALGLEGWQWLFIVEGIPAILLGFACATLLVDSPLKAPWLNQRQRAIVEGDLRADQAGNSSTSEGDKRTFLQSLRDPYLYLLIFSYFTIVCCLYVIGFWVPTVLKDTGIDNIATVGLYSMIPFGISALGMVTICRRSDRKRERRVHLLVCALIGALTLILIPFVQKSLLLSLIVLAISTTTIYTCLPLFWSIATGYFAGSPAAAGSLAFINSLGLIGGFVSPTIVGWVKTTTGNLANGLFFMAGLLALGALVQFFLISKEVIARRGMRASGQRT